MLNKFDYPSKLILKLASFDKHPLMEAIKDFGLESVEDMLEGSYLYIGPSTSRINSKNIAILHFHSSLNQSLLFSELQNLHSYDKIQNMSKEETKYICLNILRDKVIDLSKDEAITTYVLKEIYKASRFIIADETGYCKEYEWVT